ncbi:MAG TPA: MATE family efflux transporter, partial [Gammaproteobacteria bacterium]|nr:MATE family efflux transporter [Gammaproteobacteria bacterium]
LVLQLILNITNIILDLVFVVLLEWSVEGVAVATLIAEAVTLIAGFWILGRHFKFF